MKSRITLSSVFLLVACLLTYLFSCRKGTDPSGDPSLGSGLQLQWLNYSGTNQLVNNMVQQLKQPGFSDNIISDCSACTPDWDKFTFAGHMGDTLATMLVPVVDKGNILSAYIRIALDKNSQVKKVAVFDYIKGYLTNNDPYDKALRGMDLTILYSHNNLLPAGFSPELAKRQFAKQSKIWMQARRKSPEGRRRTITTSTPITCNSHIDLWYSSWTSFPSTGNVAAQFMLDLQDEFNNLGGIGSNETFSAMLNENGIDIVCSPGAESQLTYIVTTAFADWQGQFPEYHLQMESLDISTNCSGGTGQDPDGSGNGPGGVTPPDPVDPCAQKAKVNANAQNTIVAAQNNQISSDLAADQSQEYGTEAVLLSWTNPSLGYSPKPVRASGTLDALVGEFTWNDVDGYTIGFMHDHPGGTAPSPDDVLEMRTHLTGPVFNNVPNVYYARQFYEANVSVTVITTAKTYVVTINDWAAIQPLFDQYESDPTTFDNNYQALATQFGSSEMALLKIFGNTINVYTAAPGSTDFKPLTLNAAGTGVMTLPCN